MQARRRSQAGHIIAMPGGVSIWPDALHCTINNLAVNTKSLQLKFVDDIKIGRVVNNEAVTRNWIASLAGPIPTKYVLIASDAKWGTSEQGCGLSLEPGASPGIWGHGGVWRLQRHTSAPRTSKSRVTTWMEKCWDKWTHQTEVQRVRRERVRNQKQSDSRRLYMCVDTVPAGSRVPGGSYWTREISQGALAGRWSRVRGQARPLQHGWKATCTHFQRRGISVSL